MSPDGDGAGQFIQEYPKAFIRRCHELVGRGYARLDRWGLAATEEPAITGMLVDEIRAVIDDPEEDDWVRNFEPKDDEPVTVPGKVGKARPRIDITVVCVQSTPRNTFRFEAKRLHDAASLAQYLGTEGLLALLTGYYGNLRFAGMLGYVQGGVCDDWSVAIQQRIAATPPKYFAVEPVRFEDMGAGACFRSFGTLHATGSPKVERHVSHLLLLCA
jgi:hypothetical protein